MPGEEQGLRNVFVWPFYFGPSTFARAVSLAWRETLVRRRQANLPLILVFVTHNFDVVPIRSKNEGSVVLPAILRPQTGTAIVCSTGFKRCTIKVIHLLAIFRHECQMKM